MTILLAGLIGFAVSLTSSISSDKAIDNYKKEQLQKEQKEETKNVTEKQQ